MDIFKKGRVALLCALLVFLAGGLAACKSEEESPQSAAGSAGETSKTADSGRFVNAEIVMQSGGVIKLELDREAAPITVDNFVSLVNDEFYDGLTFHRVIKGFMIQGGDPLGNGSGGPGYTIKGEFSDNGWDNPIRHEPGVISMARSPDPNSAGSQFFIVHGDASHLDGGYAAFGRVTEGFEVVDKIAAAPVQGDAPLRPEVIASIRITD